MASAQVLKKQEHLQAGKKKLEEFRKKRAAEKAKKATSNSQQLASDGGVDNQHSGNEHSRIKDSAVSGSVLEPSEVHVKHDFAKPDLTQKSDLISPNDASAGATPSLHKYDDDAVVKANNYDFGSSISALSHLENKESRSDENLKVFETVSDTYDNTEKRENDGALESVPFGYATNHSTATFPPSSLNNDRTSSHFAYDDMGKSISEENHAKDLSVTNDGTSHAFPANVSPSNPFGSHEEKPRYTDRWASDMTSASYGDYVPRATTVTKFYPEVGRNAAAVGSNNFVVPDKGYSQLSSSGLHSTKTSSWASDSKYDGFSFDARSSSSYSQMSPPTAGATGRRTPSFLDSINISKVSAASPPSIGSVATDTYDSMVYPKDTLGLSNSENLTNSSSNGSDLYKHAIEKDMGSMDNRHPFYSQKQNEDFAALEQHIEDLTQEKFSLQRALEASRTLAESLAAENSALTDSYNQQGSFVGQLKAEMEKLQEEIKAHLGELEAVKMEYTNVQLECNAADERAKLLASEVIGLEEKALRLRSNELKLEKELEKSQAEMSSFKKKIASLEKDRQDLQSTINALKEEKKLLQSKFLKASANEKSVDPSRNMPTKIDVSTSTEDLREDNITSSTINDTNLVGTDGPTTSSLPDFGQFSLESLSLAIPPDQIRMIQNINTLISELALEKDELTKALSVESSQCSTLKELNKDLTRKLEVQTQRLELLTAQSMANENNIQARQPDAVSVHEDIAYADEGDEVVERVLGWIMKLFPGGPSRRRTSKLL